MPKIVTLSAKSSRILGENKASFCREGHNIYFVCPGNVVMEFSDLGLTLEKKS